MITFDQSLEKISRNATQVLTIDGVILGILIIKSPEPLCLFQKLFLAVGLITLVVSLFCCIGAINTGIYPAEKSESTKKSREREDRAILWYSLALFLLLTGAAGLVTFECLMLFLGQCYQSIIFGFGLIAEIVILILSRDPILTLGNYDKNTKEKINNFFATIPLIGNIRLFAQFGDSPVDETTTTQQQTRRQ